MDLKKLILNNLSEKEIETLLEQKRKLNKVVSNSEDDKLQDWLQKKYLPYKNPLFK